MKIFAYLLTLVLGLAACGVQAETISSGVTPVQIQRLNTDYAVGQPRVSFALFDGPDPLANVAGVTITAVPVENENARTTSSIPATSYADYEIPYWVAYPQLSEPGLWGITAVIQLENGEMIESQFVLEVKPESAAITVGEKAVPSQNKTLATEPDLYKLSSGNEPDPDLYQMTVAEAISSGKPTVIAFATPGLCQTKWCSPVLDSVTAVKDEMGEAANFIHIEVYDDFQTLTLVPEMAEWGLDSEPWVYVLNGDGQVTAQFSGPLSPRELREALQSQEP